MIKAAMMIKDSDDRYLKRVFTEEIIAKLGGYVELYPGLIDGSNLEARRGALRDVEAVFSSWWMPELTAAELETYLPNLKIVFYGSGTVQYFARPFLSRGVTVVSARAANSSAVAEYTMAQILLANKGFFQNTVRIKRDYEAARSFSDRFTGNHRAKIGILGAGMIGSMVIGLLRPFNLEVKVYDPYLTAERARELGVERWSLEEIFSGCHVISNHVPNLPETIGMLKYEILRRMKPYATLINTGRGAQIAEDGLIRALREDGTRTAVLDVTEPEPPLPDSPLWTLENVTLTSHIAGSMGLEMERLGELIVQETARYAAGQPPEYAVSAEMLETMA